MPRFVLLEHRWEGFHWDLMIEVGDRLRTWALDAPIAIGEEVPARALADHRRLYLDYEGDVSGGRGAVRRVDWGTYEVLTWTQDLIRLRFEGAQLVGDAELRRLGDAGSGPDQPWWFRLGNFA